MIEIKLPTSAAVSLLTEQMQRELESRQRAGLIEEDVLLLNDLDFPRLKQIAEISAFDLVMLLPVDLLTEESNLPQIISKCIRALAPMYHYNEFNSYTDEEALHLLKLIRNRLESADSKEIYQYN